MFVFLFMVNNYIFNVNEMDKVFTCNECSISFKNHQHLRRHYKKRHPLLKPPSLKRSDVPFTFSCEDCDKEFNYFSNLIRHIRKFHAKEQASKSKKLLSRSKDFKCEFCSAAYSRHNNLKRHKRLKHIGSDKVREPHTVNCSLCSTYLTKKKTELFRHFEQEHKLRILTEIYKFKTENDFLFWKNEVEYKTEAKFVCRRSEVLTAIGRTSFHNCHRSGYFHSKSKELRKRKNRGSCKINSICPARMKVIVLENGNYLIEFTKTHVGHANEFSHSVSFINSDQFINSEILPISDELVAPIPCPAILHHDYL